MEADSSHKRKKNSNPTSTDQPVGSVFSKKKVTFATQKAAGMRGNNAVAQLIRQKYTYSAEQAVAQAEEMASAFGGSKSVISAQGSRGHCLRSKSEIEELMMNMIGLENKKLEFEKSISKLSSEREEREETKKTDSEIEGLARKLSSRSKSSRFPLQIRRTLTESAHVQ